MKVVYIYIPSSDSLDKLRDSRMGLSIPQSMHRSETTILGKGLGA